MKRKRLPYIASASDLYCIVNFKRVDSPMKYFILTCFVISLFLACTNPLIDSRKKVPVIGFLDFIQDPTIELAKQGFFDALREQGFSEVDSTIQVVYANAQGDIPTLNQSCDYILSKEPDLIGTNVTLSTITAVKRTKSVPIFMMVAPRPDIAGLTAVDGKPPANLYGVYETLDYIDSAVVIINELFPKAKRIGTVFNQSEPQSKDAYNALYKKCNQLGLELISLPVNNSSETQLVTEALLNKKIDAFFALPDNVIFASFEIVAKSCDKAGVPVFTSEAGLVTRGALASFGADFYYWGYQSGALAAKYLLSEKKVLTAPEIVNIRKKIYNPSVAQKFGIQPDSTFKAYTPGS
ncbi:MAG: ABC transporter substrate-binding protein [Bacteroidetes bacterium]|nr:ABC transporter substrate-binding protein [Bacteroidota bacterium]